MNVDEDALAWIEEPNEDLININDCGDHVCTGAMNIVLKFTDTSYDGGSLPDLATFQIVSVNTKVTETFDNCELKENWFAYQCSSDPSNLAMLIFESLDADREDRSI